MKKVYVQIFAVFLLLLSLTAPVTASSYDHIFNDPTLSSQDKLNAYTTAIGWTPELSAWLDHQATEETQPTEEDTGIIQTLLRTFGFTAASDEVASGTGNGSYTEEQNAAYQQQLDTYYEAFALNYMATAAYVGAGSGTAADPYIITTPEQLAAIADDLTAAYALGGDIDLSGSANWAPIGSSSALFTGSFDGRGYTISNLMVYNPSTDYQGLFGYVAADTTISNIVLINVDVTGAVRVGGLVGRSDGLVYNIIIINGQVTGMGNNVGGIVGTAAATNNIYQSSYSGHVTGATATGGIVGSTYGTVTNCYTVGNITGSGNIGGIVGSAIGSAVKVTNCYTVGNLSGNNIVRGIIGYTTIASSQISNSVALQTQIDTTSGTSINRIAPSMALTNNYANADMLVNGVTVTGTVTGTNGADVDSSTYHTQTFYEDTLGWDFSTVWAAMGHDNLPVLRIQLPAVTELSVTPIAGYAPLNLTLSAAATGSPTSHTWQISTTGTSWTQIATGQTAQYTISTTGTYYIRVNVTNQFGTTTSDTQMIQVTAAPVPIIQTHSVTPTTGQAPLTLTLTAAATNNPTYTWQISTTGTSWTQIATGQTAQYTIPSAGTYQIRVVAANAYGSAASDPISVTVTNPSVDYLYQNPPIEISSRGATLSAEIVGSVGVGTKIWFEVRSLSGVLIWKTSPAVYAAGQTLSVDIAGMPLLAGQTYTSQAFADGYTPSNIQTMTLLETVIPVYIPIAEQYNDGGLNRDPFNISRLANLIPTVYGNAMGGGSLGISVGIGVIMMFILVGLWLRQQDMTIPMAVGLMMGIWILAVVPPEFKSIGYPIAILSIVGLGYQLYKNKYG